MIRLRLHRILRFPVLHLFSLFDGRGSGPKTGDPGMLPHGRGPQGVPVEQGQDALPLGFGGGAQEAEAADALKTARQDVLEETAEELFGRQAERSGAEVFAVLERPCQARTKSGRLLERDLEPGVVCVRQAHRPLFRVKS